MFLLQVGEDIATINQALVTSKLNNASLQPNTSSFSEPLQALLAVFHNQTPPNQATLKPPYQDQSLETQTGHESNQAHASWVDVKHTAHNSGGVELQSCASELLYAIGALRAMLSRHQAMEDADDGGLNKAIIQALSDQVEFS